MTDKISSPLKSNGTVTKVGSIKPSTIIEGYNKLGIDVSGYFQEVNSVEIYECDTTGYQFYYPYSLVSEASLYEQLQEFDWNYKHGKWEHEQAIKFIQDGMNVLDIGCGTGNFLSAVKSQRTANVTGIELNKKAAAVAKNKGINVVSELLDEHMKSHHGHYDVICSFQVLEHVVDVQNFIENCVEGLKEGGLLIFGVPNNDSFIKYAKSLVLNMPPHHMGLWKRASLEAIQSIFPLKLRAIEVEPLQELDWYNAVMVNRYLTKRWQRSLFYRLKLNNIFSKYISENANNIAGHTIVAVYDKQ